MKVPVSLNVNGIGYELLVEPDQSLADTLRTDLSLTGTKRACNEGECGSCSVLLDGVAVNPCLTLAVQVQGHQVTTIEGLSRGSELHPLRRPLPTATRRPASTAAPTTSARWCGCSCAGPYTRPWRLTA